MKKNITLKKFAINKYYLIMVLVCFLPRIVLSLQAVPFRTRSDEFGSLAVTAYLAGLDWDSLSAKIPYYGFGATMLFVPLFSIISNPVIIYKIMIGFWGIIQGTIGCIAWHIGGKYFAINDEKTLLCMSSIASYAVVTRHTAIFNETPLIFITWLIVWVLLSLIENIDNKRKKVVNSIVLCILFCYSLTIHTRAIMFLGGIIIVGIFFYIIKRRVLYSLPICCTVGFAGYFCVKKIVECVQNNVWLLEQRERVANVSISISGIELLLNVENWQAWLNIVLGQINTFSLVTGTLIIVAFVWLCKNIIDIFTKRKEMTREKILCLHLISFSIVCICGTILGQSISEWLIYAAEAMKQGMNSQAYGVKGFTYIRYAGPYIGVLVWTMLILCVKECEEIEKIKSQSIIITLFCNIYWLICIVPYIYQNSVTNEAFLPFACINNFGFPTRFRTYLIGTLVIFIMMIILWMLVRKKNKKVLLLVYSIYFIYQFCYNSYFQDIYLMRDSFSEIEITYNVVCELDEKGLISEVIRVDDAKNTSHQTNYVYQFCFYNKKVISVQENDEVKAKKDIIITNTEESFLKYLSEGYKGICVDELEESYIITMDEEIIEALVEKKSESYVYE